VSSSDLIRISPGDVIDDFEIGELIAEGGSSATFRATHRTLDREVALKFVYPSMFADDTAAIEAARADASRVARLEHPGIAPVYAAGSHAGGLYVASALPKGRTLAELGAERAITPAQTVRVLGDVSAALQDAHEHGVIHRDIRPDAITMDRWGHGVVRDFGVTRTSGRTGHVTRAEILASLRYTAPELVLGRPATAATDTYGLGAVTVWCLTGTPPYRDRSPADYVQFRTSAPPPILTGLDGTPMDELNGVIAAAMALDPVARPSAVEFTTALTNAVAGLPPALRSGGSPLFASEAPPATPAVDQRGPSPAAGRDATRVEHKRPLPAQPDGPGRSTPWTTYLGCAMVAATAGLSAFFIGEATVDDPPPPVRVGPFSLVPGDTWQRVGAAPAAQASSARLRGAAGEAATLRYSDAVRLPGDPVPPDVLQDAKAAPRPARSGDTQLVAYATAQSRVIARPTSKGTLIAVCSKPTRSERCAALVVRAKGPGSNLSVTPSEKVSQALAAAMKQMQTEGTLASVSFEGKRELHAQGASQLEGATEHAAATLAAKGVDAGTAALLKRMMGALASENGAAQELSTAIERQIPSAVEAAADTIRESERELERALAAFKRAGYEVTS